MSSIDNVSGYGLSRPELVLLNHLRQPPCRSGSDHCAPDGGPTSAVGQGKELIWRPAEGEVRGGERTLRTVTIALDEALNRCHKQQILWPESEDGVPGNETFTEYCQNVFISPVLHLFNDLKYRRLRPLECKVIETTHDSLVVTFDADEGRGCWKEPINSPFIAFLPRGTLRVGSHPSPYQMHFLRIAWDSNPRSRVILTDFDTALVVAPLGADGSKATVFEHIPVKKDLRALRIALAAYMHDALAYIEYPDSGLYFTFKDRRSRHPAPRASGTDEEVFASHQRHSDFGYKAMSSNKERALQFFRWKTHVLANTDPVIARAGQRLRGVTHGFSRRYSDLLSCYPYEALPEDTVEHMRITQRAIQHEHTMEAFAASERFTIDLNEDTTVQRSETSLCRTYRCRLSSLDDKDIPFGQSPSLYLKLFDDRFKVVESPDTKLNVMCWMDGFQTAEEHVCAEQSAYKRLDFMQGSLIPHYFGAHSFALQDGHEVYGILMEDVGAPSIDHGAGQLAPAQQVQLAQSLRHAVRALQYSDVTQHDWHEGQILYKTRPAADGVSPLVHCVLVDFGSTSQVVTPPGDLHGDDFGLALGALLGPEGMDQVLIWSAYGERETWDTMSMAVAFNGASECYPLPPSAFEFVHGSVN